ncbi:MAG: hypothetical protein IKG40_03890 [Bacilli bacterium]|nr:hypothetical protein [Bacilli bacterium]
MEERKNHREEKNNTGMTIAAIIAILLIIGLIAYFVMGNKDVEDAIDDVKDTTENIIENDNETKTMSDVVGSYQAKIGASTGIDEDTTADEDDYIELVLREDGTASLVITTNNKDITTGNYTVENNTITITATTTTNTNKKDNNNTMDTIDNTENYQFTINDDNTLNYMNDTNTITLSKVESNTLKYIK